MSDTPFNSGIILYDAALGGTPDGQGKLIYRDSRAAAATQSFVDGATTLDTMANQADAAGYFANPRALPALDRQRGYALRFRVQLVEEYHADSDKDADGVGDRAGFSVIALSSDTKGIEIGFWKDQVWAQEQGDAEPPAGTLFTRAESAAFDTSSALVDYTLVVRGDEYQLSGDGGSILRGRLRDYTSFEGPVNPYRTPNFIFLGDDTGSARAVIRLAYVALMTDDEGPTTNDGAADHD
ncbi:MAG TPA: hypothetical protein VFU22_27455 [Roseiflexaceae bacterium]|nr:hypothetical protein [Roseiflexaceae bacterium]